MSDRDIRASEIGEYVYCQRAWWLRRTAGHEPKNIQELAAGSVYHRRHGLGVRRAGWLQKATLAAFFLAASILVFWLAGLL